MVRSEATTFVGVAALLAAPHFGQRDEEVRCEMWVLQQAETLLHDLRYGLRQLRRNPGFTAVLSGLTHRYASLPLTRSPITREGKSPILMRLNAGLARLGSERDRERAA